MSSYNYLWIFDFDPLFFFWGTFFTVKRPYVWISTNFLPYPLRFSELNGVIHDVTWGGWNLTLRDLFFLPKYFILCDRKNLCIWPWRGNFGALLGSSQAYPIVGWYLEVDTIFGGHLSDQSTTESKSKYSRNCECVGKCISTRHK